MKNIIAVAATVSIMALTASSAFASENQCAAPMSEWQPRENLQKKLEADGWAVKRIKTEDGCYEVYAIDKDGKRVEAYFDPKSLVMLRKKIDV